MTGFQVRDILLWSCDKIATDTTRRIFSKSNHFISSQMNQNDGEVELLILYCAKSQLFKFFDIKCAGTIHQF